MEYLKIITPIVIAIIGAIVSSPLISFVEQFKRRKLKNYIDSLELLNKLDEKFQKEFIQPNLKEIYFYLQTGIYTNEISIDKYINLKKKLGGNYNWKQIKLVKSYINFNQSRNEANIYLKLNRGEEIISKIIFILVIILLIISLLGSFWWSLYIRDLPFKTLLSLMFLIILPLIAGIFLMQGIKSTLMVQSMNKKLKKNAQEQNNCS